ncbi:MAG TPA: bifunctional YncE family protein/alkaline phosphatase family protein [Bacteroidales bacterium]|nr:bifunctional YncE family protein/alkaline phosphatase family protein [Bacteroidales bacterium]
MKKQISLLTFILISSLSFGQIQLPYNRVIKPAGTQIYFGNEGLENHALDATLSPDRTLLAVEERYSIVFINTADNSIKFILKLSADPALQGLMNTYSGITWKVRNGKNEIWWSAASDRKSFVLSATWDGSEAKFGKRFEYTATQGSKTALPNEVVINNEGSRDVLYLVLNGNNKVVKQDIETGDILWTADPGVAPYGITMAAGKLYVTNWAGRIPENGDTDVAGIPWGLARVDNKNAGGATREGSVAVIDPSTGKILKEILVGLHPNEIISDAKGNFVYITNSNSDNVSVIRTDLDEVAETINVRMQPEINPFFGDSPDALALSSDNKTLYVANGMDNSVAVIRLGKTSSSAFCRKNSNIKGFIPVGAYPSAISVLNKGYLYVCNLEAEGVRLALNDRNTQNKVYNSHHMLASVSAIKTPGRKDLKRYTDTVAAINDLSRASLSMQEARTGISPVPVPERTGEPSVFKHVVYIIKENRTYDQILGDMTKGNGDPGLCIFGKDVTPNTHKLAEDFILLDNFHVSGKCSAEGHQWTDASIVTDYIEKNVRAWFRSYPHVQEDALVYSPTGFLWDNAMKKGRSVRIYGEASSPVMDNNLTWSDVYRNFIEGKKTDYTNKTTIDPVRDILDPEYPSFGNHKFPDIMRADILINQLKKYESLEGDQLPELMVVALPNDHTNGTRPGFPTPRAFVADNDYALGKIVEAFSKSRFWENTVIFIVEDDSQSGWDHVSAYRTVALVISPYSRQGNVNHTYYTQPSMVRTIEQILGLPPMNVQDAIANTMTECFTSEADPTPYNAIKPDIPLDELNPPLSSLSGKALHYARKSMLPEFEGVDSGNDDLLNRIIWYAAKGNTPYPSRYSGSEEEDED